ncbi:glycosyltransferase [Aristaeella hokkaidonensis]|uniref:Glycosyltransferase n=1 Tax=Aristaeella hokkaidonensis TaxID=3046382 RepID=A0AC61MYR1_9FIRM|nr:glycosyltransferase [Aristaeella hokkaidonensis]QUC68212.1 glycosyltransferase [Aristaeella hokkaidonensis]SNT95228.1 Glycosyl transferases group 1 [Aristaeella hokkaidonensis]
MIKILFVINNMEQGGIQHSLLELIKKITIYNRFDISLLCLNRMGEYYSHIPKSIKLIELSKYQMISEMDLKHCKEKGKIHFFFRLFTSLITKMGFKNIASKLYTAVLGKTKDTYDIAISYSQPTDDRDFFCLTNEIVINCCKAKKKGSFVHCDFKLYGGNTIRNRKIYEKMDFICAVSSSVKKQFIDCIPEARNKTSIVYNCCDADSIVLQANEDAIIYNRPTLVSVCRLSEEKGLLRCMPIIKHLVDKGFEFEWHIVGGGSLYTALEKAIEFYHLNRVVVLEDRQSNPYRFMKNASYVFVPSFHEAAPLVFDEAIILGIPVLTTNTLSAEEMIKKHNYGLVCDNTDEAILEMLIDAFSSKIEFATCNNVKMYRDEQSFIEAINKVVGEL